LISYTRIFKERARELKKLSDVVVMDGYFSKEPFVSGLALCELDVISRFRDDVRLRYIIQTQKTCKQGRPKTNGEPVNLSNPDMKRFALEKENDDLRLYTAVVHAIALKRSVRVVFVEFLKQGKITSSKVYFSTNVEMEATEILEMYQMRFQIEFVYRNARQHTSLTSCQARNKEKPSPFRILKPSITIHYCLKNLLPCLLLTQTYSKITKMSKSSYYTALLPLNVNVLLPNY
jgi:hypothetical protein